MLNISGLDNGIVLDHIPAGMSMEIYKYLNLGKLDSQVAIIKNASSKKMGKKDIIKIAGGLDSIDLDVIGFPFPKIGFSDPQAPSFRQFHIESRFPVFQNENKQFLFSVQQFHDSRIGDRREGPSEVPTESAGETPLVDSFRVHYFRSAKHPLDAFHICDALL